MGSKQEAFNRALDKHELFSPEARTLMTNNMSDLIEALQEISEAKGAFKRDPHEHAKSCIRDMQALARDVLIKHGIEPRGKPVDER